MRRSEEGAELRINIALDEAEVRALVQMARADCRHPREELRYLLREEALRRGVLERQGVADEKLRTGDE